MSQLITSLITDLQQESAGTRRALERIPAAKLDWQPHAKSMTLRALASHIAEIPTFVPAVLNMEELDFATAGWKPWMGDSPAAMVAKLDAELANAVAALQATNEEHLAGTWSLKMGGQALFTAPRLVVLQSLVLKHTIHHRGQLTVYLRLLDVPLPSIYGPSADEGPGM
jgi:uncharacterized damage-inducible protein DinB